MIASVKRPDHVSRSPPHPFLEAFSLSPAVSISTSVEAQSILDTQLKAQGPSGTCNESKEEEEVTLMSSLPLRAARSVQRGEFIDYKTSMITDKTPCGGCCSTRILVSLTHYTFLKKGDGGAKTRIFKALVTSAGG